MTPQTLYAESSVGLPLAMYALQVTAGLRTAPSEMTLNVPGDYATIQEAIDAAIDNTKIIVAGGTYNETLEIKNKILTIEGAGAEGDGNSVVSGSSNNSETGVTVFDIENSSVMLKGFLITTGRLGLNLVASDVYVESSVIEQNWMGILTYKSSVGFESAKIKNNTFIGADITSTSQLYITNSEVTANNTRGILIFNNSGAQIENCTINNNKWGVEVANASSIDIRSSLITLNQEFGLFATGSASINMGGGNTISNNQTGVYLFLSSSLIQHNNYGIGKDTITHNSPFGINITKNSSIFISEDISITNHVLPGIVFDSTSSFQIPKAPATLADFSGNPAAAWCTDCNDFSHNDIDGDGFRQTEYKFDGVSAMVNKGDCNDSDSSIYPGATEVCDGVDNDCDGEIDEGC